MNNEISKYFTKQDGSSIATDNDLKALSNGNVVKNVNSKESYVKIAENVFDKQNDFLNDSDASGKYSTKAETVKSISGDGSSTTITYQMADGTNKTFVTKDTTYSAGTGLNLSGTTFNHINNLAKAYPENNCVSDISLNGKTLTVTSLNVGYDQQGHMNALKNETHSVDLSSIAGSGELVPPQIGTGIKVGTIRQCAIFCRSTDASKTIIGQYNNRFIVPGATINGKYLVSANHSLQLEDDDTQWSYAISRDGSTYVLEAEDHVVDNPDVYNNNNWCMGSNTKWVALAPTECGSFWSIGLFMCISVTESDGSSSGGSSSGGSSSGGSETPSRQLITSTVNAIINNNTQAPSNAVMLDYVKRYINSSATEIVSFNGYVANTTGIVGYWCTDVSYYVS